MRFASWCFVVMLLAGCGGSSGGTSSSGDSGSTGTLAYVVTQCRENAGGLFLGHKLQVRQGDDEPITIRENPTIGPLSKENFCSDFGALRVGAVSVNASPFQRLGVSPDGSRIAFELTEEFSVLSQDQVPPEEEGFYVVRADGTGLRRLAPASHEPVFRPIGNSSVLQRPVLEFSPSGDRIVYIDRGPDAAGREAIQIMTLNLDTGERRQITRLPPQPPPRNPTLFYFIDPPPSFLDEENIGFVTQVEGGEFTAYTVKADGSEEPEPLPPPLVPEGGVLVPGFLVTGAARSVYPLKLGSAAELFASDGRTLIQLTNFGRSDTGTVSVLSRDGERAVFTAAGDFGHNPNHNCQLFSVGTLGADLRQLTSFDEGPDTSAGCSFFLPRGFGCGVGIVGYDRNIDTILLESSCDPFGTNPNGGQIFSIDFDGSGLRQLTTLRGLEIAADGTVTVELPGPAAYATRS